MKLHEWKTRIQSGEHLLGTMVTTFASADLPKILKACGFDFFIIDCEHGSFTTREVADMICVARAIELPGMVRIPELRREHVLHYMELGAAGLLLPNTETAEQARQLVDYAKYAPMGHRGVSLSRPHTDFLKQDSAAYMQSANRDTVLLCQIESQLGVSNIDAIMAVDGIDGAMIGPNDMSQDFGILPVRPSHHAGCLPAGHRRRCAARQGFRRTFRCNSTAAAVAEPGHDAQYVQQ